ncbi:hypothetical protein WISP_39812 [Willisornis vidua]|uniref:Uncharacterized protein n=1 Tax=Willisornis vidua TaxID=1566151 RepID=A0ABQ9DHA5_9PASS|nr:hypothetical protein WISP_39812 [Willisornis vidua]
MEEPPRPLLPRGEREDEEEEEEEEEDGTDTEWSFVDGEMEAVALRDLPSATIACNLDPRVFQDGPWRGRHPELRGETQPQGWAQFLLVPEIQKATVGQELFDPAEGLEWKM